MKLISTSYAIFICHVSLIDVIKYAIYIYLLKDMVRLTQNLSYHSEIKFPSECKCAFSLRYLVVQFSLKMNQGKYFSVYNYNYLHMKELNSNSQNLNLEDITLETLWKWKHWVMSIYIWLCDLCRPWPKSRTVTCPTEKWQCLNKETSETFII